MDENGEFRDAEITGERPLTIYVDKNEIVTLMTLGSHPELLTLGYLFNQRFINDLNEVRSVQVDWEVDASVVNTWKGIEGLEERLGRSCLLYTSPSPRDGLLSRMPSSA